jgi:homoserine kinase type II
LQSVVRHVAAGGFLLLPVPIPTIAGDGFCKSGGYLWELTPWLPGTADYWSDPRPKKLHAALSELARFHIAAATFANPESASEAIAAVPSGRSPGIADRLALVNRLLAGELSAIRLAAVANRRVMPLLAERTEELFALIAPQMPSLRQRLTETAAIEIALQPCLRDVWHDHVLFQGDRVGGIVDVEAMRIDSVAGDVARLLGSLCPDDPNGYDFGLAAYQAIRPLSKKELALVAVFDQSQRVLAGAKWVQWVFVEGRTFADPSAVQKRMDHILKRLQADSAPLCFRET